MTYLLAIPLALAIPTLLTLAVLYARAVRQGASERVRAAEGALELGRVGGELRVSQARSERRRLVIARLEREIRELEDEYDRVGDPALLRRGLDNMLQGADSDEDEGSPPAGPVPNWATPAADEPDSD
jgi:hypothetical protein